MIIFATLFITLISLAQEASVGPFEKAIQVINQGAYQDDKSLSPIIIDGLTAFQSDGCSVVKEEFLVNADAYMGCCLAHDFEYWLGGLQSERKLADQELRQCIARISARSQEVQDVYALIFYAGVRAGGRPHTGRSYQWGYGWDQVPPYTSREFLLNKSAQIIPFFENEKQRYQKALPLFTRQIKFPDSIIFSELP